MIMKLFRQCGTAYNYIITVFASIAAVLIIFLMLFTCYGVIMRYAFSNPATWAQEISEYILVYIALLGAAWLLKEKRHVVVDIVYDRLNPKSKLLVDIIISVVGVILCLIMTWYSGVCTWEHMQRGAVAFGLLSMPLAAILGIFPLGFFLVAIQFVKDTFVYMGYWRTPDAQKTIKVIKETL